MLLNKITLGINIVLRYFGYFGMFVFLLIIFYIIAPDRFEKIIIHFLKIFSYINKRIDKSYLKKDLEHAVKEAVKLFNRCFPILTYNIKIIWVEEDVIESYLDKGYLVIRMRYHKNRARNLARALIAYIPYTLPKESRAVLESDLNLAISCTIAKEIAKQDPEVVRQLYEAVETQFKDRDYGKNLLKKFAEIDEQSLFTRILLPEISNACLKAYPRRPQVLYDEISELIDMLYDIVRGTAKLPILKGRFINLGIVRVASPDKVILDPELVAHLNFAKSCGTRILYVLAAGHNAKLATKLTHRISKELRYRINFEETYKALYRGKLANIYCGKLSVV